MRGTRSSTQALHDIRATSQQCPAGVGASSFRSIWWRRQPPLDGLPSKSGRRVRVQLDERTPEAMESRTGARIAGMVTGDDADVVGNGRDGRGERGDVLGHHDATLADRSPEHVPIIDAPALRTVSGQRDGNHAVLGEGEPSRVALVEEEPRVRRLRRHRAPGGVARRPAPRPGQRDGERSAGRCPPGSRPRRRGRSRPRGRRGPACRQQGGAALLAVVLPPRCSHRPDLGSRGQGRPALPGDRRHEDDARMRLHAQPLAQRAHHDRGLPRPGAARKRGQLAVNSIREPHLRW